MAKKYILTGGPGSGKSSIILALEALGEHTVREAAEDFIRLQQARGIARPWELQDFQDRILDLQLQREARIPASLERAFLDRGTADGLAYAKPGTAIYERILRETPRYERVFLIENLGSTQTNAVRRENQEEALKIERALEEIYTKLGYEVTRIEPGTVEERTKQLLSRIQ